MITLKTLESYITDDILDELFFEREDKIYDLEEIEKQKEIFTNDKQCNEKLQIALNNLPDCLEEVSKGIKESVAKKVQAQNEILAYFYEKFYKVGFCDGMSLILKCVNKKEQTLCEDAFNSSENKF